MQVECKGNGYCQKAQLTFERESLYGEQDSHWMASVQTWILTELVLSLLCDLCRSFSLSGLRIISHAYLIAWVIQMRNDPGKPKDSTNEMNCIFAFSLEQKQLQKWVRSAPWS